jgi:DNA-binding FrmR family transcriptional regulator
MEEKTELLLDDTEQSIDETCCEEGYRQGKAPEHVRNDLIKRLNRIEGQIRGIKGMIERNVYCDDILNQMSAVQSALHSVSRLLLDSHIKTCVMERLKNGEDEVVQEFMKTITKLMK